jgi:hypothetical protein
MVFLDISTSGGGLDPQDPHVFGPSESISQRYHTVRIRILPFSLKGVGQTEGLQN